MIATEFIVGSLLTVLLFGGVYLFIRWVFASMPCFGNHELGRYSSTGDYRVVAKPTHRVLPNHQCEVEVTYEYAAHCQRFDCDYTDTKWKEDRTETVTVNSLEDIASLVTEDDS